MKASKQEILRHSLGLTRKKKPYRNHFAAARGTDDYATCEALTAEGLMVKGNEIIGGYGDYFFVTDAGKGAAQGAPSSPTPNMHTQD